MGLSTKAVLPWRLAVKLRYLDVVVVLAATVPALVFGAPKLGYLLGAGGWMLQRVVAATDARWIRRLTKPLHQLGFGLAEAFARTWLLAGFIVLAGLVGGRVDGLTAALVILGAYSMAFAIRVLSGPPRPREVT